MEEFLNKLVKRCKANDHSAFEILYKKYYRVLLGVSIRYSGNRSEAEDILQDAFIKIFHNIGSYSGKGSFEGWLKRIVQNTAINSLRNRMKFDLYADIDEKAEETVDENFASVFQNMDVHECIELLNKIPEGYRVVLNLFYIDGYTHKEISGILNISTGTSKSQLYKAKNYLKNIIASHNKVKIS
jgi:RNA polymerase sigma factor (sigma-70 family)